MWSQESKYPFTQFHTINSANKHDRKRGKYSSSSTSKMWHEIIQRPRPNYRNSISEDKNMAPAKHCSV